MSKPTIEQVLIAVSEMRTLQKDYFRSKNPSLLERCKACEKRVDKILEEFRRPTLVRFTGGRPMTRVINVDGEYPVPGEA